MPNTAKSILSVVGMLGVGIVVAVALMKTKGVTERTPPPDLKPLVEVIGVKPTSVQIVITATGTVIAARQVNLTPQLGGAVTAVSPSLVPGGIVHEGQELVRIDDKDYLAVVTQREAQVQDALYALAVEEGSQTIARAEWEAVEKRDISDASRRLMLREPHLERARANVAAARSSLVKATRDVSRTVIRAPFNAVVERKGAELGQILTQQSVIATLVGIDEYWVRADLPASSLQHVRLPGSDGSAGTRVKIVHDAGRGTGVERAGTVYRLLPGVESRGKMAQLLVRVEDPLGRGAAASGGRLLLDSFVRVEIPGTVLDNVFVLPRTSLHEGAKVWLLSSDSRIEMRDVTVAWRRACDVVISSGLAAGDRVITSHVVSAVNGLAVRTAE